MIIDAHGHIGKFEYLGCPKATADWLVEYLDMMKFDMVIVSSIEGIFYDLYEGNIITMNAMRSYPNKILGYLATPSLRLFKDVEEMESLVKEHGFVGLKIYSKVGAPINEVWTQQLMRKAAEMKIPILAHAPPDECACLSKAIPDIILIMAHMGCGSERTDWNQAIMTAEEHENILLETCSSCVDMGMIETAVKKVGAERVIFGTDVPLLNPWVMLEKVRSADISEEEKRLIFGENMTKILRLKRL